ncbi:MAG: hypothetical protein J7619_23200 [Dyadobacter sp.]|uniref:hypothetical protein n=1 Tax=Dyadobacter sp. TaxID=1914288 RepID=UPI001B25A8AC|nr:hypothetical protein [Dyadobacter sp.]MBO9615623.1 hypothetical protein [Dyadobacter sp.]
MKLNHWKIIAGLLVVILGLFCVLWYQGFRQPTPNPDAPYFGDTIRENQRRAYQYADTVKKHHPDYENKLEGYRKSAVPDSVDPDGSERDRLGASIESAAKADSIRKRTPR